MIYYVEDDTNIRELVVYTLNQTGVPAKGLPDAAAFWTAMADEPPALVMLDIMLPNEDGLTILRRLRADKKTRDIPVIMVTAKGTEYDKVQGLELGADDYIAKPFGMAELVARVKAMLRRLTPHADGAAALTAGGLTLDPRSYTVTADGQAVPLTRKEFELLQYLMQHSGAAFTREKLLDAVWDYGYDGGTRTVDVHIQTLRTKLGAYGTYVETVRGIGYRFGGRA